MAVKAALAEELAGFQDRNHGFLALLRQHGELDPAFLDVEYRIGDVTLGENALVLVKFEDRFPRSHFGEKRFGIESAAGRLPRFRA